MEFRWNEWNVEHIGTHGVAPDEAEQVVCNAEGPYLAYRGEGKYMAWGRGRGGRLLQVVYIFDDDDAVYVIHARQLADKEKRRFQKRRPR